MGTVVNIKQYNMFRYMRISVFKKCSACMIQCYDSYGRPPPFSCQVLSVGPLVYMFRTTGYV